MYFILAGVLADALRVVFERTFEEHPFVATFVTLGLLGTAAFLAELYLSPAG
jgi:hypothetical protein